MSFSNFDPLSITDHHVVDESVLVKRTKRGIHSILHSYVGWYDPFAELIQNALDSIDKKNSQDENRTGFLSIIINLYDNSVTVSDNGVGLDKTSFERFLAPHESFKDVEARGSKGVGATFLAYGFNYIRIDTKTKQFSASGEMEGGRLWLHSENVASNPQVYSTTAGFPDPAFEHFDTGVSITIRFGKDTKPNDLAWPGLNSARSWHTALSVKTALGSITSHSKARINIRYIPKNGDEDVFETTGTRYLAPHEHLGRHKRYDEVVNAINKAVEKKGADATWPASIRNLEAVHLDWQSADTIRNLPKLTDAEKAFIEKHSIRIAASYMYGAGVWESLAKKIGYRRTAGIYGPGIQLAADNMPQGELIQIPLTRYTGRQNQAAILMHFSDCTVDLGV